MPAQQPEKRYFFSSVTRISTLAEVEFALQPLPRRRWGLGDYVAGEVTTKRPGPLSNIELASGRMVQVLEGDLVVGAWGVRKATLEAVGDWRDVGRDRRMHSLTGAGLFGRCTSLSPLLPPLLQLKYRGHVQIRGVKARMQDFVEVRPRLRFTTPVVLLVGSSMSAGKTTSARIVTRLLKKQGLRVVAAKLTGAGRYRDILSIQDAGADAVFDFVDVGLPSTICDKEAFVPVARQLLSRLAETRADVAVIEVGASPLEGYNVSSAIEMIHSNICCTILCASDPYSVVGVMSAFNLRPDLAAGIAASTGAGIELIERLSGLRALNLVDEASWPELRRILGRALNKGGC